MRRSTCYGMQAQIDRTINLMDQKGDKAANIRAGILRKMRGYSRERHTAITKSELHRWFRATPMMMLDIVLDGMVQSGVVIREKNLYRVSKFTAEHYYPDGSLLDRCFYDSVDDAVADSEKMLPLAAPGETIVICRRFGGRQIIDQLYA